MPDDRPRPPRRSAGRAERGRSRATSRRARRSCSTSCATALTEDNLAEPGDESLLSKVQPRVPLIRLAVRAPAAHAELVLAALLELAPGGVEQVDATASSSSRVYGAPGELPALPRGEAEVAGVRVSVSGEEVADDWEERWQRFHRPVLVAGRSGVRPPWEQPADRAGRDRARGRSRPRLRHRRAPHHAAVASSCCSELDAARLAVRPRLRLGRALDRRRAARLRAGHRAWTPSGRRWRRPLANARVNGVALERVERADLREEPAPAADVVTANLMRPLLLRVAELMRRRPRDADRVGAAGGRGGRGGGGVRAAARARRLTAQGWSALLLAAP